MQTPEEIQVARAQAQADIRFARDALDRAMGALSIDAWETGRVEYVLGQLTRANGRIVNAVVLANARINEVTLATERAERPDD